eukprot:gene22025-28119_t
MTSMSSFDLIENDHSSLQNPQSAFFAADKEYFGVTSTSKAASFTSCESYVQLQCESLAYYFHKLLEWRQPDFSRFTTSPLFGEPLLEGGLLQNDLLSTTVSVECNAANKRLFLIVRGNTAHYVSRRSDVLEKMVEDTLRNRKIHELPGWQSQHRLAILDSNMIMQQQEISRACVLFHYSGATTRAEIVSLQPHQHSGLLRFLQSLKPREAVWEVSEQDMSRYSEVAWESLRVQHAVYCQWIKVPSTTPYIAGGFLLKVWGFAPGLDEAVRNIQALAGIRTQHSDFARSYAVVSPPLPSPPPVISRQQLTVVSPVRGAYSATYAFRDREAGIFFYAFERQFRSYMEYTFAVALDDCGNKFIQDKQRCGGGEGSYEDRNAVLKVTFHAASQSHISSARAYLEQMCPSTLTRLQVFFPQVHSAKFKELCNKKAAQMSVLTSTRSRNQSAVIKMDPMQCLGFVNIRVKPSMHGQGVRRMTMPADCTITICGSSLVAEHTALLREIEASFEAVGSEYAVGSIGVSFANPLKKQLTVKAQREHFVQQHGLVAVKWEEGSRLTGSVGAAKLWAPTQAALASAVSAINAAELQASEDGGFECGGPRESSQWDGTHLSFSCPPSLSGIGSDSISPSSMLYAFGGLLPSESRPVNGNGNQHFKTLWDEQNLTVPSQSVVYWPDDSLRYVLLSDPLSSLLNNLLFRFYQVGVTSKYPYRDRANPCAGILLMGGTTAVSTATQELNTFLQSATNKLRTVQVVLPFQQYADLVTNELAGVKHLQGQAGVRVVLGARQSEIEAAACSAFDLRLAPKVCSDSMDVPLLTVRVSRGLAALSLDVAVISNRTSPAGWTWGVACLLVVIDPSNAAGLAQSDLIRLSNGEVLVQSDTFTGKTILRLKPLDHAQMHGAQQQAKELMTVIGRGLSRAEELGLSGVAVAAPVDCDSFRGLDADQIRSLTVEAVVEFAKIAGGTLRHLRRVACIDVSAPPSGDDISLLAPAGGDPMARTMLSLLDQQRKRQEASLAAHTMDGGADCVLSLVDATVPLSLHMACAANHAQQPGERRQRGGHCGDQSVLLKGLPCGIRKAVDMLSGVGGAGAVVSGPRTVSPA